MEERMSNIVASRYVNAKVLYNGKPIPVDVTDISYTDNAEGSSDDISITVHSSPKDTTFIPEKEAELDVTLYFNGWRTDHGISESYHCGTFVLDDISYSGSPDTLVIKGVAQPASEAFTTLQKNKTWENTTLREIANAIMANYTGMSTLYYNAPEIKIESIEQNGETDSSFLKTMCDKYNLCLKIYKVGLVIFSWETYEQNFIPCDTFDIGLMESYTWNTTVNGTYTGAHLKYTTKATKKKEAKTIEVTVGQGPRLLELTDKVESETEAKEIARQKVNAANMEATTLSFQCFANAAIFASFKLRVVNSGRMNGDYMITKVTHSLSSTGGETSNIECYKMFDRL